MFSPDTWANWAIIYLKLPGKMAILEQLTAHRGNLGNRLHMAG